MKLQNTALAFFQTLVSGCWLIFMIEQQIHGPHIIAIVSFAAKLCAKTELAQPELKNLIVQSIIFLKCLCY